MKRNKSPFQKIERLFQNKREMFNRYGFHTGYIKTTIKTDSVEGIAILNSLGDVKKK